MILKIERNQVRIIPTQIYLHRNGMQLRTAPAPRSIESWLRGKSHYGAGEPIADMIEILRNSALGEGPPGVPRYELDCFGRRRR